VARETIGERTALVRDLEAKLAAARESLAADERRVYAAEQALRSIESARSEATKLYQQADELQATLTATAPGAPSDAALEDAAREVATARAGVEAAERARAADLANKARDTAASKQFTAQAEADRYDVIVKALANDAPKALLAESGGIDGIEIDGDTIRLDGVSIDSLSSGEALIFSTKLAKRLNKTPFMIIDHLEHLPPKRRDSFLREAGAGGWQLFVSETTDDDQLVITAIEFVEDDAAAAE
jgi:hypothetical protein